MDKMIIKGGSFEEVCQTLRALKKAFVINKALLKTYYKTHIREKMFEYELVK